LLALDRLDEAEESCENALHLDPKNAAAKATLKAVKAKLAKQGPSDAERIAAMTSAGGSDGTGFGSAGGMPDLSAMMGAMGGGGAGGAGGMPDLSALMGAMGGGGAGGASGMPDLSALMGAFSGGPNGPDLAAMMQNPEMKEAASNMMRNPQMMQVAQQMMQNPEMMQNVMKRMGGGPK
jgi:small glutamine-rich tetratricopeptide repeat-containing protein alpha